MSRHFARNDCSIKILDCVKLSIKIDRETETSARQQRNVIYYRFITHNNVNDMSSRQLGCRRSPKARAMRQFAREQKIESTIEKFSVAEMSNVTRFCLFLRITYLFLFEEYFPLAITTSMQYESGNLRNNRFNRILVIFRRSSGSPDDGANMWNERAVGRSRGKKLQLVKCSLRHYAVYCDFRTLMAREENDLTFCVPFSSPSSSQLPFAMLAALRENM